MRTAHADTDSPDRTSLLSSILDFRIWKLLIVGAVPFLVVITTLFETLERAGSFLTAIADMLMSVSLVGYIVLIVILKKRNL